MPNFWITEKSYTFYLIEGDSREHALDLFDDNNEGYEPYDTEVIDVSVEIADSGFKTKEQERDIREEGK
jgi:hypothetical protein|tara:strand:- start:910 stop:1116 length:207 start_codon:yes stop_codon:yes gene_type:complete